ncbi:Protein Tob1 [Toxocara canis]|uniref:Protein Tob1 n=1 Tax=Toxocara canis TaxID=6265 RepID=A0A0B2V568_TOXCA|nr:Protein Tob1 [Toxocara canis]
MYTELKELVNFLAKFTRNRIPRRRMSIFLEHLANGLLVKHEAAWKVDNPISGATERAIRINTASGTTELLTSVASTLGIDIHALLSSFPMEMVAFWNPGEVFYRLGDTPTNLPIWSGDVNADTNYSCAPARLYTFEPGHNSMPSANVGSECNYVRLELAPWDQHSDFYWSTDVFSPSNVPRLVFRFVPPHDQAFTASSFAVTRFGSRRPQPDHEALKRIQHAAEHLTVGGGGGAPIVAGTTNMPPNKQNWEAFN